MNAKVVAINISEKKGTTKQCVESVRIDRDGIVGDAHAGTPGREISLLSYDSVQAFEKRASSEINHGDFAENILISGLDFSLLIPGVSLKINDVTLNITQVGKSCHGHGCRIYQEVGDCIMPREGVFASVIAGGQIHRGDPVSIDSGAVE